jgi:hypothetical protein
VLTGELVVTNAARNQFRLVGHGGSFTAPADIPVEALDGKPVQVDLTRDGRVLEISEEPIHFEPIEHGFEVISGELVVRDPLMRTFAIAGDDRVYVAPARVEVSAYAGRMVRVRLDETGRVMAIDSGARAGLAPIAAACSYNGRGYSDGASLCQSGIRFRCQSGAWRNAGSTCAADAPMASPRAFCTVGDAHVANGSSICRAGATFRCTDGEWVNLGKACS